MGLEVLNRETHEIMSEIIVYEDLSNISNLIIPFSIIFKSDTPSDIYSGEERIPFEEKNPEFKQILISEFLMDY
ncbi:MAG: hypothetical protein ACFE9Q_14195 [Candidatus Hodarchaeota archaeon]